MSRPRTAAEPALAVPHVPVERFRLGCGALLLVSHRPKAPVCAVQVHMRGGHSLDPPELYGLAYLTGSLVDRGTRNRSEEEIAGLLEPAGGSLSGTANGVHGTIAGERWELLLELLAESLVAPTYTRAKLEREKKRLLDRLTIERDEPRVQAARLFRRLVYGDHWLGRSEYGELETVARLERRHLVDFHRRNWCASRAVIAFCGDVEPARVKRFLDRALADWRTGKELPPPDASFPPLARRTAVFPAERQQVHVFLGHLGIRRTDPDFAKLVVMDHVLGTGPGFTSRITRKLRDELGLAYTVDAAIHSTASVLPGMFTAYIGTSPRHLATAVRGFLAEIRRVQARRVSKAELDLAKRYLTGSFVLGFERAGRRATHLVAAERNHLPEDHLERLVQAFAAVTADDVRDVARRHLHPDATCLVVAGPVTAADVARALTSSS